MREFSKGEKVIVQPSIDMLYGYSEEMEELRGKVFTISERRENSILATTLYVLEEAPLCLE